MSTPQKKFTFGTGLTLALLLVTGYVLTLHQPAPAPQPAAPVLQQEFTGAPEQLQELGATREDGEIKFGYTPRPQESARFVAALPKPTLAQAGPEVLRKAQDQKPVLLYRALYEAYAAHNGGEQWRVGKQGIGDCVSWGWKHGCDINLAVMWKHGDTGIWKEAATESIYGGSRVEARGVSRGGYSDGSYGAAAAKWVNKWGCVFRKPYAKVDLTKYSASRAKEWGNYGNGGKEDTDGAFDAEAKLHPVKNVVLVRNFSEAAAAIQSGYPVPVCSGQGFASKRDELGFARASGHWAHCMCFIGYRGGPRPGLLCLNSWGTSWISGPKWPEDQPDGSFWVDERTVNSMLAGNDSFAVSGYEGFPYKDLTHGDWVITEPGQVRHYLTRLGQQRARREELASYTLSP